MAERLDALSVKENNGKSYFTKLGVAFPNKDGKGYMVLLDAIPAPVEGQYKLMLREPLPKDGDRQQSRGGSSQGGQSYNRGGGGGGPQYSGDLDDDAPFLHMDDPLPRRVL